MSIEITDITKTFGSFTAVKDVSLCVETGELLALLGPSGSGKTTLLRVIAGLEAPDAGNVRFQGEDATQRSARERGVGFVFQHYALFRHMSVFENVAFGLRVLPRKTRPARAEIKARVMELLSMVQLSGMADRLPSQLSGGQRQRVALARALAVKPRVLLLDEPFGALDAKVRQELRDWLRQLHRELHVTSIFVTHDQDEALEVADRVVVMNQGRIEQVGTPEEVYEHPANPFVYNFLGSVNLFHGRVHNGKAELGPLRVDVPQFADSPDAPVIGYVRPHNLDIQRSPQDTSAIAALVRHVRPVGAAVRLELQRQDNRESVEAELTREQFLLLALTPGEQVYVTPTRLQVFLDDYAI
jgi:sulfate/thiosulfate transport system ATP-binding protein